MNTFIPNIILRHKRENLKKCSLRGLEEREDLLFYTYPQDTLPPLNAYIVLTLDGPLLQKEDQEKGLFLIDGTWKYAEVMFKQATKQQRLETRSLPKEVQTAYPRRQDDCSDPNRGLASVEALFVAYGILGRKEHGLLDHYYWKELFLEKNKSLFKLIFN